LFGTGLESDVPALRVTSIDVARRAGVSQSAVSRVFSEGASVGATMRERVLRAASELGYEPNALARSLSTGRSRIIGLVVSHLDNLFYPAVIDRLCRRLQKDGYHLLMFVGEGSDSSALVGQMLQYRVDGIVLGSITLSSALAQRCADAKIPVVLFNRVISREAVVGSVCSVRSNNLRGGAALARHLIELGHSRIAFIAGREDSSTNRDRERGFTRVLRTAGLSLVARAAGHYDPAEAAKATRAFFLANARRPDAVFAASDQMALAVIDTLRHELHLQVPGDVSVVGYDDVPQAAWPAYQLTTFQQPVDRMVEATMALLDQQLTDGSVAGRHLVVPGQLQIRHSTAARKPMRSRSTSPKAFR
jgi:DNA-binding LacI/PurR family transcriptional regulator